MRRAYPTLSRISPLSAIIASAVLTIIIAVAQFITPANYQLAFLFVAPQFMSIWARSRRWTWGLTIAAIAYTAIELFFGSMPLGTYNHHALIVNRCVMCVTLLISGVAAHLAIGLINVLFTRGDELEAGNAELAAREVEIAHQNEELQSQTEELERQSEELRVSNDELARREKLLEAMLSLSRGLSTSVSSSETMSRICDALGDLLSGQAAASAILRRDGDHVRIVCHHGFGDGGPLKESWPFKESFASLVLDRDRTGYLEDVALRPDLQIPQPRQGPRMVSILSAPLRIGGKSVGSLEVYTVERQAWTDEQINLIESLAAQASISLEAADLFENNENERQRLQTILDTMPIGISIADARLQHITFNTAGALLIGVVPDKPLEMAVLTTRLRSLKAGVPLSPDEDVLGRALRGQTVSGEERELILPDGRRIGLLVSAAPIRHRDGAIVGAVSGFVDITRQKQLQIELDARRREAEEASVRKTRFLAAVSHDIRTPANAISLLAELLQRSGGNPAMTDEIPEIARDLKSSAISLVHLVSDVLDLTRFDSGKVELTESEFPLAQLIFEEGRPFAQVCKDKGLAFQCNPPDDSIIIRADRVKVARIIGNLVGNAVKFTEHGSVTIQSSRLEDGRVQIQVIDTGPGIAAEHQEQIFDEYFQLKSPKRDEDKGSGLGLAICRRLATAMDAQLTVNSAVCQGSTFTLMLPATCVTRV